MAPLPSLAQVTDFIAQSVAQARASNEPFFHLEFDRVFPDELYVAMLRDMPAAADYHALPGHKNANILEDGTATRAKIELFPTYIHHLPRQRRAVWNLVGRALTSKEVTAAFLKRMAPALKKRFGDDCQNVDMFPRPVLTRDVPRYRITPHTDTRSKGITVQFYLPPDDTTKHIGTIFHRRLPDGSLPAVVKMPFSPNSGYAFVVDNDTWHSADPVGPEVKTRDSILQTYMVDRGVLLKLRNRSRHIGNLVAHEVRRLIA
jgi:hypothetical protein